jgi:hypothetical protein
MAIVRKVSLPIAGGAVVVSKRVKDEKQRAKEALLERIARLSAKRDFLLNKKQNLENRITQIKDADLIEAIKADILALEKYLKWIDKRLEALKKLETAVIQKIVPTQIVPQTTKEVVKAEGIEVV